MIFVNVEDYLDDVILDMRYCSNYNFVGRKIDGYFDECALMTKRCALALKGVSDEIRSYGFVIKIFDAYRPQRAVDDFVAWADNDDESMKDIFYKNLSKREIFEKNFVAYKSAHSRGSTVDLTFYDVNLQADLDVGGSFDLFDDSSRYDYKFLSDVQKKNRRFIRNIMIKYGFLPFDNEWWHFTLEDEPFPNIYFDFPVKR